MFFLACALVAWWAALQDRGVVIDGFIHLGPGAARVFFGVLTVLSLGFVALAVLVLIRARTPREVVLDDDQITIPALYIRTAGATKIQFADIVRVREQWVGRHQFLTIYTRTSKHHITANYLPEGAFAEIARVLETRVPR